MLTQLVEQWEHSSPGVKALAAVVVTVGSGLMAGSFGAGRYTAGLEAKVEAKADQEVVAAMATDLQRIREGVEDLTPAVAQVVTDVAIVRTDVGAIKANIAEHGRAAEKVHDDHEARLRAEERKP